MKLITLLSRQRKMREKALLTAKREEKVLCKTLIIKSKRRIVNRKRSEERN